jgi:zinc-finger of transposase IS204/IS1001/IS1096/IS1165
MSNSDTTSPFLPLPDGIFISSVRTAPTELVVHIACWHPCATCPLCQQPSERVHGHYGRMVADLPCGGRRVILALTVRKFVCSVPTCPRKIFTERLPYLDKVVFRVATQDAILKDLQAGIIDSVRFIDFNKLPLYQRLNNYMIVAAPTSTTLEAM